MKVRRHVSHGSSVAIMDVASTSEKSAVVRLAEEVLQDSCAVYVRGLSIADPASFRGFLDEVGVETLDYRQGNSPRLSVTDGVFTSTEYPAAYEISLHNEMSYATNWPGRLFFCCLVPACAGGQTHLADGSRVLEAIDPGTRRRFVERGVLYRQCLHDGLGPGKSWQQTYGTADRAELEAYLRAADVAFEWGGDGELRTSQARPATQVHPARGVEVWFNQAEQWHISALPPEEAEALTEVFDGDEDLPLSVAFGDGSPISLPDLHEVRAAAAGCAVDIDWRAADLLIVDNMASMHGRRPFSGPRSVLVAMS